MINLMDQLFLQQFREGKQRDSERKSFESRLALGKSLRKQVRRTQHAEWICPMGRPDVLTILEESNKGRIQELVPVRHQRMAGSPFRFFRGLAALMALDLKDTPTTGLKVQACGDCHIQNFGAFATPERNLIFDINDFDETTLAPWEWDVKRLAVSAVLGGREKRMDETTIISAVAGAIESYRTEMHSLARKSALDVWYSKLSVNEVIEKAPKKSNRQLIMGEIKKARSKTNQKLLLEMTKDVDGQSRIVENPPLIFHPKVPKELVSRVQEFSAGYYDSLSKDRRVHLDRYRLADVAMKVVGIGSVGTYCAVALFLDENEDPLFLQFKEARPSVLETYGNATKYEGNQGERVVTGQRIMQAASDIFLGWSSLRGKGDFYFRQLRDMKISVDPSYLSDEQYINYLGYCGQVLARAHARSGQSAMIAGYMGKSDQFEKSITKFGLNYENQVRKDFGAFIHAISRGQIPS